MKRYGNYVENISKNKLYKMGYEHYVTYWSDKVSQQNMLQKLIDIDVEYLYTQKKDKTGLYKIQVYKRR